MKIDVYAILCILLAVSFVLPVLADGPGTCGTGVKDLKWNPKFLFATSAIAALLGLGLVFYHETLDSRLKYGLFALAVIVFFLPFFHALYSSGFSYDEAFFSGDIQEHAYLFISINGTEYQFPPSAFSKGGKTLNKYVELENGNSNLVHLHARGVTWAYLFTSVGLSLSESCIKLDKEYCANSGQQLQFFSSGKHPAEPSKMLMASGSEIRPVVLVIYYGEPNQNGTKIIGNLQDRVDALDAYLDSIPGECR